MDQAIFKMLKVLGIAAAALDGDRLGFCTEGAQNLGIYPGMPLSLLLPPGVTPQELHPDVQFSMAHLSPCLYAQVTELGGSLFLIFREEHTASNGMTLSQTARMLRIPLNDIFFSSRRLFERLEELEDEDIQAQTARLNRNFYHVLRTANALSEVNTATEALQFYPRRVELRRWLEQIMASASSAVASTGRTLVQEYPAMPLFAEIDRGLLEQALWCLLSNAIRYSPADSTITLRLRQLGGRSLLTLTNKTAASVPGYVVAEDFAHPMGAGGSSEGLGLGLARARRIVARHSGTLVLDPGGDSFTAGISLPTALDDEQMRTCLPTEHTGGFNALLIELADVLPDEAYDSRNL